MFCLFLCLEKMVSLFVKLFLWFFFLTLYLFFTLFFDVSQNKNVVFWEWKYGKNFLLFSVSVLLVRKHFVCEKIRFILQLFLKLCLKSFSLFTLNHKNQAKNLHFLILFSPFFCLTFFFQHFSRFFFFHHFFLWSLFPFIFCSSLFSFLTFLKK